MIRHVDQMVSELKVRMRGGNGQVTVTQLFEPGEFKGKARLCARLTLEKGCSIGYHEHVNEEEIFYIISGIAVLIDSTLETEQVLKPGDAAITLAGESHSIRNDNDETLEVLALILTY